MITREEAINGSKECLEELNLIMNLLNKYSYALDIDNLNELITPEEFEALKNKEEFITDANKTYSIVEKYKKEAKEAIEKQKELLNYLENNYNGYSEYHHKLSKDILNFLYNIRDSGIFNFV